MSKQAVVLAVYIADLLEACSMARTKGYSGSLPLPMYMVAKEQLADPNVVLAPRTLRIIEPVRPPALTAPCCPLLPC